MISENRWVAQVLNDFVKSIPAGYKYFCIGSVALLSFISENVHQKKIKDIDIICDISNFEDIKKSLLEKNYCQFTFVDKKLNKIANNIFLSIGKIKLKVLRLFLI